MQPYGEMIEPILDGESGSTIGAFFDLDGTIIASHSIKDVFLERLKAGQVSATEVTDLAKMTFKYLMKTGDFQDQLAASVKNTEGVEAREFEELGERVYTQKLAREVFPEVRAMIRAHQEQGHTIAIVSSATRYQIEPLARALGIDHILCTELEIVDGLFTGELAGPACYGQGKVDAAEAFAEDHDISMESSYFYSNGSEDIPLLEAVGYPVAIAPDKALEREAERQGWPVHHFESRGSTGIGDIVRTVGAFGSVLPALAAGLPILALGGSRRDAMNFSINAWAGLGSAFARLKMIVEGEEHLWWHRPAVFIFNHQSAIDMLITAKLLREDIVGVAKKEIQRQPIMGPALTAAGAVFIDRDNVSDPKAALQPAIEALDEGRNVLIAPEGTRSRDGKLGQFKKGAFHLAMQAQVPIVPIVIHNALDALPNHALVVRPAEVKVTVLPPISTEGWTVRDVVRSARAVRKSYLEILEPG